ILACRRATSADADAAVALLRNTWAVLRLTGPFVTAVELGQAVGSHLSADDAKQAIVDRIVGAACYLLGDVANARIRFASALQVSKRCGDLVTHAHTQCLFAELELTAGDADAAAALLHDVQ